MDLTAHGARQGFEPASIVASQCDVERAMSADVTVIDRSMGFGVPCQVVAGHRPRPIRRRSCQAQITFEGISMDVADGSGGATESVAT